MAITEEIARLTGKLVFQVDNRPLMAFEKRLNSVIGQLRQLETLANKKFNIKVQLDSRTLREQLAKAASAKVTLKDVNVSQEAMAQAAGLRGGVHHQRRQLLVVAHQHEAARLPPSQRAAVSTRHSVCTAQRSRPALAISWRGRHASGGREVDQTEKLKNIPPSMLSAIRFTLAPFGADSQF